jgi:uncharacterized protein
MGGVTGRAPGAMRRAGYGWAFIDLATLGRNTAWSYTLTLVAVVLAPIAFLVLAFASIFVATARHWIAGVAGSVLVLTAAFVAVIIAGVTLLWRVARGHRRPWMSLISCDLRLDWRRLAIGAGVEGAILLLFVGLMHVLVGRNAPSGRPGIGLPGLLCIMLLVPFQAASEEMLFRGYLTQALGRVLRSRAIIATIVGVIFAALHADAYGILTMPYLFALSALYSIVSLRDERLELTIGAHAATNWFGVGATNALAIGTGAVQLGWAALAALAVNGVLFYAGTRLLVRTFYGTARG